MVEARRRSLDLLPRNRFRSGGSASAEDKESDLGLVADVIGEFGLVDAGEDFVFGVDVLGGHFSVLP